MRSRFLSVSLCAALALGAACSESSPTTPSSEAASVRPLASLNGGAPTPIKAIDVVTGFCPFVVVLETIGKTKTVVVGKDHSMTLVTSPSLQATLTRPMDPTKHIALSITGAFHVTSDADGNFVYTVTGRNLVGDPIAGFVLAEGVFSFTLTPEGFLVRPLSGNGQLTNICALLS